MQTAQVSLVTNQTRPTRRATPDLGSVHSTARPRQIEETLCALSKRAAHSFNVN